MSTLRHRELDRLANDLRAEWLKVGDIAPGEANNAAFQRANLDALDKYCRTTDERGHFSFIVHGFWVCELSPMGSEGAKA